MGLKRGIHEVVTVLEPGVTMHRASDGGPSRFPVTGLKQNTTHLHPAPKAGGMLLPAESNSELAAMYLLDISTSVLSYMAQPHLLKFSMDGEKREYTPDLELVAPFWLAEQLLKGMPFVKAALKMPAMRSAKDPLVNIVLEIKKDRRKEKGDYTTKIKEVSSIYGRHDFFFFVLEQKPHLTSIDCSHLPSILLDHSLVVRDDIVYMALEHLRVSNGVTTYAAMMDVFGGGPTGREITNYLHIRGLIWVDFSSNPLFREKTTVVAAPPLLGRKRRAAAQFSRKAA